jgi:hypothetical protein
MRLSCSVLLHLQQQPTNRQNVQLLRRQLRPQQFWCGLSGCAGCMTSSLLADQVQKRGNGVLLLLPSASLRQACHAANVPESIYPAWWT